jgi:cysteinyl-tRNA synthetase
MAYKYLGESFDIHAGGEDLVFPHHENEIAQSEGATGKPLARYWLHNGFLTVNGEKMAKSLGNFITIRDTLGRFSPEALKFLLLSTNYRGPLDYSEAAVHEKARALTGIQDFLRAVSRLESAVPLPEPNGASVAGTPRKDLHPAEVAFRSAMDDDFNTARATGVLFDLVREGNRLLREVNRAARPEGSVLPALRKTADLLRQLGAVLGLTLGEGGTVVVSYGSVHLSRSAAAAIEELDALLRGGVPNRADLEARLTSLVQELLAHREAARRAKAWAMADGIRQALAAHGFRLEDTKTATHVMSEFAKATKLPPIAATLVKE